MLGVDRLDMIKGIPQKLLAFEKFLEENPGWRDRVLLVQIAVPSRTDVPEYQVKGFFFPHRHAHPKSPGSAPGCHRPPKRRGQARCIRTAAPGTLPQNIIR